VYFAVLHSSQYHLIIGMHNLYHHVSCQCKTLHVPTVSLEDVDGGGAGRVTDRRKFKVLNVRFLLKDRQIPNSGTIIDK
jgi:hypothetical protein